MAFLLFVTWWAWHGYAVYTTRFDARDGIQRATTLLQMVAVIFMAANAEDDLASESSAGFAAAYALMRLILVGEYLRASTLAPTFAHAQYYAGLSHYRANRPDLMAARFERFLKLAPDAPERPEVQQIMKTIRGR